MSMNSVNTNSGAMVALEALNTTNTQLDATQKQISTGYRVNDATDDGAAYAVAQGVRSNVAILTAANNQLGNASGLLGVTNTALSSATTQMTSIATDLTNLADSTGSTESSQYSAKLSTDVKQMISDLSGANYNGASLIGSFTVNAAGTSVVAASGTGTSQSVVTDELGNTTSLSPYSAAAAGSASASAGTAGSPATDADSLAMALTQLLTISTSSTASIAAGDALASVSGTNTLAGGFGVFANVQTGLQNMANVSGAQTNFITNQQTYNSSKIDSLNTGLGSLVDADLAAESAQLTSLQIKQQLGQQALSIANQAPSGLISLFRG